MRKQRAFQPTADQLETREPLSSAAIPAHITHAAAIPAHITHATVSRTAFSTPFAQTLSIGFATMGTTLSSARTATRSATTPVHTTSPFTTSGMGMTTTAVPGQISGLTFPGAVPGLISGLSFAGAVPGQISGLTFAGAVPGQISGLTFTGAMSGIISGLSFPNNIPE